MNNETEQEKQEQIAQDFQIFKEQQGRFYNEIKRKSKKHVENFRPLIEEGYMKVKGMTQEELGRCLTEALGTYDLRQADRSAKENHKRSR